MIFYLELRDRGQFIPVDLPPRFELCECRDPAVNERFYRAVGQDWQWTDRLSWTREDWREWVEREGVRTWIALFEGSEVGYVELEKQAGGEVEIVYFGLLSEAVGQGLGKAMLAAAVRQAWAIEGTQRVWLHTCTEDHPHALVNYERRGFTRYEP